MRVIDISKHQVGFKPAVAKAAGVEAVIIRLAYGASPDKTALKWADSIHREGLPLGGYGFATWHYRSMCGGSVSAARNHMRQQVCTWIEAAKQAGVDWYFAIDQELESGESMALSMDENTTIINEAADLIRSAGFKPLIYCSVSWDFANIRTSHLAGDLNYWFAYYPNSIRAQDFDACTMAAVPGGMYGDWLCNCYQNGRLAGWQYGSTGFGAKYGCNSVNLDRSIFYIPYNREVFGTTELHAIVTGEMSKGDLEAVKAVLEERGIGYEVT